MTTNPMRTTEAFRRNALAEKFRDLIELMDTADVPASVSHYSVQIDGLAVAANAIGYGGTAVQVRDTMLTVYRETNKAHGYHKPMPHDASPERVLSRTDWRNRQRTALASALRTMPRPD